MVKSSFGTLADGTAVDLYTLTNSRGVRDAVTARPPSSCRQAPDKDGKLADVVLGDNRSTTT